MIYYAFWWIRVQLNDNTICVINQMRYIKLKSLFLSTCYNMKWLYTFVFVDDIDAYKYGNSSIEYSTFDYDWNVYKLIKLFRSISNRHSHNDPTISLTQCQPVDTLHIV